MGDTTNDEAANYGKRPRVIETLDKLTRQYEDAKYGEGFVRTLVDSLKVTDEQCMEYFTNEMEKKYGKEGEQPKREPMLSNNEIYDESYRADLVQPDSYGDGWDSPNSEANWAIGAKWTRERYEDLIDNGVLAVVKMAGIDAEGNCTECGWDADHRYPFSKCCPGCGAIVVEQ